MKYLRWTVIVVWVGIAAILLSMLKIFFEFFAALFLRRVLLDPWPVPGSHKLKRPKGRARGRIIGCPQYLA